MGGLSLRRLSFGAGLTESVIMLAEAHVKARQAWVDEVSIAQLPSCLAYQPLLCGCHRI
jgi:hypothetical protein